MPNIKSTVHSSDFIQMRSPHSDFIQMRSPHSVVLHSNNNNNDINLLMMIMKVKVNNYYLNKKNFSVISV